MDFLPNMSLLKEKMAVFWDVEDCPIPEGLNAIEVSRNMRRALADSGFLARAAIYAYGDEEQTMRSALGSAAPCNVVKHPPPDEDDIANMEIDYRGHASVYAHGGGNTSQIIEPEFVVNYTPAGDRDAKLDKILTDLFCWALDNRRSNLLVILGSIADLAVFDRCFLRLYMSSHLVLLAQPQNASGQILGPAPGKLFWEDLSRGYLSFASPLKRKFDQVYD